jgi:hypothetical protein
MRTRPLIAVAAVLVAAGLALIFWPAGTGLGPTSTSSPTPPASNSPPPPLASSSSATIGTSPAVDQDHADPGRFEESRRVVEAFATAFTAPVDQNAWLVGLQPYVTPQLLDGFTHTDPQLRPAGQVQRVRHLEPGDLFRVTYSGGYAIACTVVPAAAGGWVVSSVEPVRPRAPTGNDL